MVEMLQRPSPERIADANAARFCWRRDIPA